MRASRLVDTLGVFAGSLAPSWTMTRKAFAAILTVAALGLVARDALAQGSANPPAQRLRDTGLFVESSVSGTRSGVLLAQSVAEPNSAAAAVRSLVGVASRFRPAGAQHASQLVVPGASSASVLPLRMRSRDPRAQMPPLGTDNPDYEAVALIERWTAGHASRATAEKPLADSQRGDLHRVVGAVGCELYGESHAGP